LKGQASGQVADDEVDTGIGPVLAFADLRVRWTFIGLMVWKEAGFKMTEEQKDGDE
jgi:hypothetical protein